MAGTEDIRLDPAAAGAVLRRLGGLPGVISAVMAVDDASGRRRHRFDHAAHHFVGASGLASALRLATRTSTGVRDARSVVEALDRDLGRLLARTMMALGATTGADATASDLVDRTGQAW
ncbi:hypothetical protein Lfu02_36830 [Longispora fulva]|uniref:Uncharacterized protein n=1 Tax=Longispora fulva TaxID=619741 RepID=A0A8J7KU73_9ACTN|nr:hypothetical protein [Longispora fulva]MBG6141537.1 hypothetical protein [Longispora fulva]GIG59311.1 hypothetical protein Lfu02_36830 [Longispora fulva]